MPLSNEERDRIREEEWVRLQAREDFYKTNPTLNPGFGPLGPGRGWRRREEHPGFVVAIFAIIAVALLLGYVVQHINWNHIFL